MVDKLYFKAKLVFAFIIIVLVALTTLKQNSTVSVNSKVVMEGSSNNNGAYFSNLDSSFINTALSGGGADPTITRGTDDCLYIFTTNKRAFKSCDSKVWSDWSFNFDVNLPNYDYYWAPEVHKIGNYYYMFFTLVTNGSGYPWSTDSFGSVYYARSTDLKNFTYLGEMPYGSNYFTGKVASKNHIDGSLLIDGSNYYFYYKLEHPNTAKDYQGQEIYGIQVGLKSDGKFYEIGNPQIIIRRNTESNPIDDRNWTWHCWQNGNYESDTENIDEGPYVIKRNGKYYLTFSVGEYTNDSYHVVAATSSNPLGPYIRDKIAGSSNPANEGQEYIRDFVSGTNYPNTASTDTSRDSSKYIYGTGHGSILTITNSDTLIGDYTEYYYVYHSNKYANGKWSGRKITLDSVGFTKDGVMYLNGPTTGNQPLVSGSIKDGVKYYRIPTSKYTINDGKLSDGLRYTSKNVSYTTYNTNTITITFGSSSRSSLTDIWLYGNGNNIGTLSGTLYINEGTRKSETKTFTALVSGSIAKIQLPDVLGKVKNVRVVFNKTLSLSEVELIRNSQDNFYQVTFNPNGGTTNKNNNFNSTKTSAYSVANGLLMYDNNGIPSLSLAYNSVIFNDLSGDIPTKSGYKFNGWFTAASGGTKVYDANGKAINGNGYWSNNLWVKKSDVVLYAQWTQTTLPVPTINNYTVKSGIIYIPPSAPSTAMSVSSMNVSKLGISSGYTVKVYDKNSSQKTSGNLVTSDIIKIYSGSTLLSTYQVTINGDTTGDGKVALNDIAKLYQYYKGKVTMDNIYRIAGNVAGTDDKIALNDIAKLYQYYKGKINSLN